MGNDTASRPVDRGRDRLMTGVVGGDVGRGRYAGEIISDDTTSRPGFWLGHVTYEFHGHSTPSSPTFT